MIFQVECVEQGYKKGENNIPTLHKTEKERTAGSRNQIGFMCVRSLKGPPPAFGLGKSTLGNKMLLQGFAIVNQSINRTP